MIHVLLADGPTKDFWDALGVGGLFVGLGVMYWLIDKGSK